ncbi:MAG: CoB--CoM heterodisulfide reductase iron-sulfur subunit A family protein [Methanomicrobiales archaeon]|nr:CoB--CoM heterodisulfide reductase iron-sulfur subunit A family protein [Methanomicrobiales archaeon]
MNNCVVIGGGIAGITAALDIANHGIHVSLIEREPTIGGHMAMLDKTFPTNDCSMCILSPKMVEVGRHPNITLYTCSEVVKVEGEVGNFIVTILRHPRYILENECNGCGDCVEVCPVEVYNRFDAGVGVRKAIFKSHPQVVPNLVIRDKEHCIDCGLCYDICGRNAVLHDDEDEKREISLQAMTIVLATGYEVFDAREKLPYKYLRIPDVITSLELERLINASGPTGGKVKRISNGEKPKEIVFIQCVGSRDIPLGCTYCSAVCCMYAIKNAMLIKEKDPSCRISVLYMDIRAYGKGYQEYYDRAESLGIRFIRGMPGDLYQADGKVVIQVENTETTEVEKIEADLIVLSVGIRPTGDASVLAEKLGITCDDSGFFASADEKCGPVKSLRPGIFIAGTCKEPMDIPDSVMEGGAAAMQAVITTLQG